jgi:hypothetical protein
VRPGDVITERFTGKVVVIDDVWEERLSPDDPRNGTITRYNSHEATEAEIAAYSVRQARDRAERVLDRECQEFHRMFSEERRVAACLLAPRPNEELPRLPTRNTRASLIRYVQQQERQHQLDRPAALAASEAYKAARRAGETIEEATNAGKAAWNHVVASRVTP